ncbi:MAG: hypothetical protein EA369_09045 [Bradymonadales bacterium]|nr:MAG: hypothetical protein EA369_09045 [Bradymonadales bacterium]
MAQLLHLLGRDERIRALWEEIEMRQMLNFVRAGRLGNWLRIISLSLLSLSSLTLSQATTANPARISLSQEELKKFFERPKMFQASVKDALGNSYRNHSVRIPANFPTDSYLEITTALLIEQGLYYDRDKQVVRARRTNPNTGALLTANRNWDDTGDIVVQRFDIEMTVFARIHGRSPSEYDRRVEVPSQASQPSQQGYSTFRRINQPPSRRASGARGDQAPAQDSRPTEPDDLQKILAELGLTEEQALRILILRLRSQNNQYGSTDEDWNVFIARLLQDQAQQEARPSRKPAGDQDIERILAILTQQGADADLSEEQWNALILALFGDGSSSAGDSETMQRILLALGQRPSSAGDSALANLSPEQQRALLLFLISQNQSGTPGNNQDINQLLAILQGNQGTPSPRKPAGDQDIERILAILTQQGADADLSEEQWNALILALFGDGSSSAGDSETMQRILLALGQRPSSAGDSALANLSPEQQRALLLFLISQNQSGTPRGTGDNQNINQLLAILQANGSGFDTTAARMSSTRGATVRAETNRITGEEYFLIRFYRIENGVRHWDGPSRRADDTERGFIVERNGKYSFDIAKFESSNESSLAQGPEATAPSPTASKPDAATTEDSTSELWRLVGLILESPEGERVTRSFPEGTYITEAQLRIIDNYLDGKGELDNFFASTSSR